MSAEMVAYYSRRAAEYESIYFKPDPVRLFEQEEIARAIRALFVQREVLEVAAGTGYWTVHAAAVAKNVIATDISSETLEIASTKPLANVKFLVADAYDLRAVPGNFDAALSCCWLSHVSRSEVERFIECLHNRIGPGGKVFLADNVFVEGVGGQLVQEGSDSYKIRELADGSRHKVLKNYYSEAELRDVLIGTKRLSVTMGERFWWLSYEI